MPRTPKRNWEYPPGTGELLQRIFEAIDSDMNEALEGGTGTLSAEFTFSNAGTPVLIGTAPAGSWIESCNVIISTAFNGQAAITVGETGAQGRLQATADNVPSVPGVYEVMVNYKYTAETDLYLYLSGAPTVGSGRVIVYF